MQFPLADGPPVLPLAGQMILEFTSFSKWSNFAILLSCRLCHHPSNHIKPISHFHNCPSIFHTKQRKKTGFFQPKFMSSSHPSKNGVEERWITKLLSSKVFVRKTKSSVKRWINTSCSRKSPGDFWRCVHIYYVYNNIYIYIYEKLWRCCLIVLLIWSLCFFFLSFGLKFEFEIFLWKMHERWMKSDEPKEGVLSTFTGLVLPVNWWKLNRSCGMAAFWLLFCSLWYPSVPSQKLILQELGGLGDIADMRCVKFGCNDGREDAAHCGVRFLRPRLCHKNGGFRVYHGLLTLPKFREAGPLACTAIRQASRFCSNDPLSPKCVLKKT